MRLAGISPRAFSFPQTQEASIMNDQIKQAAATKLVRLSRAIVATIHEFPDATPDWHIFVAMNVESINWTTFSEIIRKLRD
jgi:hypothetical protein